ncbi:hypothetical protein WJX72_002033 [[Myrmecia] bisecta]|uniref:MYND-type domain-containing protein n=1 Tax=[Myrmecia] bisecta TaxID=41462 RepID=A0AAW1QA07_9CHLO
MGSQQDWLREPGSLRRFAENISSGSFPVTSESWGLLEADGFYRNARFHPEMLRSTEFRLLWWSQLQHEDWRHFLSLLVWIAEEMSAAVDPSGLSEDFPALTADQQHTTSAAVLQELGRTLPAYLQFFSASHSGLVDVYEVERPSTAQLDRFHAHMTFLLWMARTFEAVYNTEVISREVMKFDWSKRRICNRLACPINQAWLQAHPNSPVHLAFEAFVGVKLRKCSGCQEAWYCSPECQKGEAAAARFRAAPEDRAPGFPAGSYEAAILRRLTQGTDRANVARVETALVDAVNRLADKTWEVARERPVPDWQAEQAYILAVSAGLDACRLPDVTLQAVEAMMWSVLPKWTPGAAPELDAEARRRLWAVASAGLSGPSTHASAAAASPSTRASAPPAIPSARSGSGPSRAQQPAKNGAPPAGSSGQRSTRADSLTVQQVKALKDHGNECFRQGNYRLWKRAIDDCTKALELDPRYWKAHVRRCQAAIYAGDTELALPDLRALYRQVPLGMRELHEWEAKGILLRQAQLRGRAAGQAGAQGSPHAARVEDASAEDHPHHIHPSEDLVSEDVREVVKRLYVEQCSALLLGPVHEGWRSLSATQLAVREQHFDSVLNRLAWLMLQAQCGLPIPCNPDTAGWTLQHAAISLPYDLLRTSPGLLPWCLTFSVVDRKLQAYAKHVVDENPAVASFMPGADMWEVLFDAMPADVLHPRSMWRQMAWFVSWFLARCVGVPPGWLQEPRRMDIVADPLPDEADRHAALRRLCELWANPLVRLTCNKAMAQAINALCHLFMADGAAGAPSAAEWDIICSTPGFLAGLASCAFTPGSAADMRAFLLSLPLRRWRQASDGDVLSVFLCLHCTVLNNTPVIDPTDGKPMADVEFAKVLVSLDRMLSTPERRMLVVAPNVFVEPFVAWVAHRAGLTTVGEVRGRERYQRVPNFDALSTNIQRTSSYAKKWAKLSPSAKSTVDCLIPPFR